MHKKNCKEFAEHVKLLIGGVLDTLELSDVRRHPQMQEVLEQLEKL